MATLEQLQAQIAKLQAQAETLAKEQSSKVLAEIRDLMHRHGVTLADVQAHLGGKRGPNPVNAGSTKTSAAAKYRDPKSGATWSGRGRAPAWIVNAKNRSKFLVDGEVAHTTSAPPKTTKPGNYARGPQAPKYRDPKTGATWSGRGPAPAWLAGAKDRTKFLIDGLGESAPETTVTLAKAGAGKKVAARKVATNKAAAKKVTAKKVTAKIPAAKKAAPKKVAAKSNFTAMKKSAAKKAAVKKAVAKKAASKQTSTAQEASEQAPLAASNPANESTAV